MKGFSTPLVSVEWLAENLENLNLIVLNATIPKVAGSSTSYDKQIKGARFFDIKRAFSNTGSDLPNTFPSEQQFETETQSLGINKYSYVVVYDEHGIYSSPRAWWLFRSFGHQNVAVLDGGLPEWIAKGLPTEAPKPHQGTMGDFKANYQKEFIKKYDEVLTLLNSTNTKILDARSNKRFRGSIPEPRKGLRSGHIPSSINLPYSELVENGKLLTKEALQEKFKRYQNQELVFSCGSGITACILALGAEVAGYKNLSVYDGSWTEWGSRHELPLETN